MTRMRAETAGCYETEYTWHVFPTRVCNRLSGYSGYSDIRKNLSVRIAT